MTLALILYLALGVVIAALSIGVHLHMEKHHPRESDPEAGQVVRRFGLPFTAVAITLVWPALLVIAHLNSRRK